MKARRALSVLLVATAGTAAGADVLTFTFSDLVGDYDDTLRSFVVSEGNLTAGDVTRTLGPVGTADFPTGFAGLGTDAAFTVDLIIDPVVGNAANAQGFINITDTTGDAIVGNVDGTFFLTGGTVFFNGFLSDVNLVSAARDGLFNGFDGTSFDSDFNAQSPLSGSIVQLFFEDLGLFNRSFSGKRIQTSGILVPAPGAAGLLVAAGLVATRRRRR